MSAHHVFRNRINRLVAFVFAAVISLAVTPVLAEKNSSETEKQLIAVLQSDAPAAEKAITCKRLAIHGSDSAVPELAKLLPNMQLSSWARIALEAIPGETANKALRDATASVEGRLLIGMINSIGVRRDAKAVELLTSHLQNADTEVASAAAVALGHIGNDAATQSLRQALAAGQSKIRSAVAEGCILCAERLVAGGDSPSGTDIYDEVRTSDVPQQRIIEATRGAILARGSEGIPLLLELFKSSDKKMFQLALVTAREFPGGKVDKAIAAEVVKATPDRAALMIGAMADRPETVVLSAVLEAAKQGPDQVRAAAIVALGKVGDVSCLADLLQIGIESDEELADLAKATLAKLPGEEVDTKIVSLLPSAKGKVFPLLLETVGERRINAQATLLKALGHSDQGVRSAALTALGETVTLDDLSVLVEQVVSPKYAEDASAAEKALKAASIRMPDREACAAELTSAIEQSSELTTKATLLKILGDVGGTNALSAIHSAAKSGEDQLQDASSRLLGKWMTADAAPVLLDLAKTTDEEKYQVRALRGYIRIARQFRLPLPERTKMCQEAIEASRRPAEQKMVLEVLKRYPSLGNLKLASTLQQKPELKEEASQVMLSIAEKIGDKGDEVKKLLAKAGLAPTS